MSVLVFILASSLLLPEGMEPSDLSLDNSGGTTLFDPGLHSPAPENQRVAFKLGSEAREGAFEDGQKRRKRELEELEYRQTLAAIEAEAAKARHRKQVKDQGREFSRKFLAMNIYAAEFPEHFQELLKALPLAAEDEFCKQLIQKGRRFLEASAKDPAAGKPAPSPTADASQKTEP